MDFLDNIVSKSNALIKEQLNNNPFGNKQQATTASQDDSDQPAAGQECGPSSSRGSTDQPKVASSSSDNSATTTTNTTNQDADQDANKNGNNNNSQFAAIAADAEAVAQKATQGAKSFGTFLFSMANKAGQHVSQTAKQVKQAVENTSFLTEFTREQQEFIKEHGGTLQAGDLPWTDCNDENKLNDLREQILSLSQDRRNFVRSPPNDANFEFEPQVNYPIALSLLKEDPNLNRMRYELVPKLVNEDTFWRNYFYRVTVLRQLCEKGENIKRGWSSSRSSSGEGPDEDLATDEPLTPSYATTTTTTTTTSTTAQAKAGDSRKQQRQQSTEGQKQETYNFGSNTNTTTNQPTTTTSKIDESPISSATTNYRAEDFESNESMKLVAEADDLKSRLRELNIGSLDDQDDDKWEEELQRDLQEFELISGGDVSAQDEEALDCEIMELKRDKGCKK